MNKRIWILISLLTIFSLMLAACAGGAETTEEVAPTEEMEEPTEVIEEPTEVMTEEPTEEMTEEPTEEMTEEPTEEVTEAAAPSGEIDCMGAQSGDEVSMLYQWSGQEEERLNQILQPLADACGIVFAPESTRDQALLDTRVQAGNPPDIAFWNITQVQQYQDQLVPMTDLGVNADNYPEFWVEDGTVGGEWFALPVKTDVKTIIWYSPINFEAFGYTVPETWEDLEALVEQMVADGNVPWSMGFESGDATGWTGTDFIQDYLLVTQGPEYVEGIIDGSIPYDDEGVRQAYEIYGQWAMDPTYTVGGAEGTLSTGFVPAIHNVFTDPPEAMMVKQSGFAGGEIVAQFPDLEFGTDFDFFPIPGTDAVQGGTDWMFSFSDEPAVQALIAYLSGAAGGAAWAESGFGLTPNLMGAGNYPDEQLEKLADIAANASAVVPDIGDSIPGGFGSAEFTGITDFVNGADLDTVLSNIAQVQAEATTEAQ